MKATVVAVVGTLLFAGFAVAAPQVKSIEPGAGFTFGETRVFIGGTGFAGHTSFIVCACPEPGLPTHRCPVNVFFGSVAGRVISVSYSGIVVMAPPQAEGIVDIRIEWELTESTIPDAFHYSRYALTGERNHVRYLVPATRDLPGANGSLWKTEMTMHNGSEFDLVPLWPWPGYSFPMIAILTPRESHPVEFAELRGRDGAFLYIPRPLASSTALQLRVRDVSREADGWGTEVPIVRVDEEVAPAVSLLDVPVDPRYRTTLRIYGDDEHPRDVRVTVRPLSGANVIEERIARLRGTDVSRAEFPFWPAYAELNPISEIVRASGQPRVRVEVESVEPPPVDPPPVHPCGRVRRGIWALISVTNDDTQQVTTITPHVR